MNPTEAAINSKLEDTSVLQRVHGPDVTQLFKQFTVAPAASEASSDDDLNFKIRAAEQVSSEAKADLLQAQGLSARLQKVVEAASQQADGDLQMLKNKLTSAECGLANSSFEHLDKLRADASQNLAKWEQRASTKMQSVKESLSITVSGVQDAIHALEEQIMALHNSHDKYAAEWRISDDSIRARMRNRISLLEEKCRQAKPLESAPCEMQVDSVAVSASAEHMETDVNRLQLQVADLLAQLATLGVLPVTVVSPAATDIADVSTTVANGMQVHPRSNDTSLQEPAQKKPKPDGASTAEVSSPISEEATSAYDLSSAFPPLESKGKGKGSGGEVHY
jgi:hypothetical protein